MAEQNPTAPRDVSENRTWIDRFADSVSNAMSRPLFFVVCLALVLVWAAVGPAVGFSHGWVDVLQIVVSLVTLLMVVLLQNEGWRGNKATQRKLNAIASALAEVMENADVSQDHVHELNAAVGLEKRESASR
jgi:low affinity Fe/Cu permease